MAWQSPYGYQMWTCEACGCLGIAAGLGTCPMCGKEREMAKVTAGGGPSDASAGIPAPQPEADAPEDGAPGAAPEAEAEAGTEAGGDGDGDGPANYDSYPVRVLRDLAKERGIPVSGTKPELVAALEASDAEQGGM